MDTLGFDADGSDQDEIQANGVEAETGCPLPPLEGGAGARVVDLASGSTARFEDETVVARHPVSDYGVNTFGTDSSVEDPEELDQAGWGIVFPAEVDAEPYKDALRPLLDLRRSQAGDTLFRIFEKETGIRRGEEATAWLARQGEGPGLAAVDPSRGVPYYLLIVASPEDVSMSFQYLLDVFWAVGRLHFDDIEDYARYAKALVDYEKGVAVLQKSRRSVLFATAHGFDRATAMFMRDVAKPFRDGTGSAGPLGKRQGFALTSLLERDASKTSLLAALEDGEGPPSLLFSGTHGMSFRKDNPRQRDCQGALVCDDWEGYGAITEDDWFSAEDLPASLRLNGMMHFLFACYGAGWEAVDTFRDGPDGRGRQIADKSEIARLPQAMLSRGALSVIAHVDRAWSYSFRTPHGRPQSYPIRDVLTRLMQGKRIGNAIDQFNAQWSAATIPIAEIMRNSAGDPAARSRLAKLWIIRDDVRNYAVLGDPAARIRTDLLSAEP